ncbi:MAG: VWA domain-containing protein, partial [Armatimonadota bacterium]
MGIRFLTPIWLLLIPIALAFVWRTAKLSLAGLSPRRMRQAIVLRTIIVVCMILALAGPQAVTRVKELCVVYVLDASKSVPADSSKKALEWARRSQKAMESGDSAGLIVFGRDARVDSAPGFGKLPASFNAVADGTSTDIAGALRLAMATFPEKTSRHIVLLSDGNQTSGDALDQVRIAKASGVTLDTVPLDTGRRDEAWVEALSIPSKLKQGEPSDARVVIGSTTAQTGVLRLYRDGRPVGEKTVSLSAGRTVLLLPQKAGEPGSRHFLVELTPNSDSAPENNKAYAYARVRGKAKVLFATTDANADRAVIQALQTAKIQSQIIYPYQIPSTAAEFGDIDGLILSNVPATALNVQQMLAIKGSVKQMGAGLAMIGGEDSFGAGGYFKTPIEDALPVRMTIRKQHVIPSMALVIVIDKSGSMGAVENGVEKIRLANEAAIACIDAIQPNDKIAVIACDSDPKLVSPMRAASQKSAIIYDISSIRAGGGGIMCFPSLKRSNEILSQADATIKHVIMLADGSDSEDQKDCHELAKAMAARKITVSVVAIGNGPDVPFLIKLAKAGQGGFYLTEKAHDLPKIFTKDTLMASRSLLVEEPFQPVVRPGLDPLQGLPLPGMPPLLGYVATTPKPTASQAMLTHKGDPLLATWQFGLGRGLAFTSDARAKWAAHWLNWPSFATVWAQNTRWVLRRSRPANWQASVDIRGGIARVTAEAAMPDGSPIGNLNLVARAITPQGNTIDAVLEQTGPGRYETSLPARETGDYVVNVSEQGKTSGGQDMATASLAYPEEYRSVEADTALMRQLAAQAGGVYNPEPDSVYAHTPRQQHRYTDLWRALTLLAALLLPIDIAVRRLVLSGQE